VTYKEWLEAIDKILLEKIELSHMDLPDQLWRDAYDRGEEPQEALENFYGDIDDIDTFMQNAVMGGEF
jgi:hypothetical protein